MNAKLYNFLPKKITNFICTRLPYIVCWKDISIYGRLDNDFMITFQDRLDWILVSFYQPLSETFIETNSKLIHFQQIGRFQELSEQFIEKYRHRLNWNWVSMHQHFSDSFLKKFQNYIKWDILLIHNLDQKYSLDILNIAFEKIKEESSLVIVARRQPLPEDFFRNHPKLLEWDTIIKHQRKYWSNNFIVEMQIKGYL